MNRILRNLILIILFAALALVIILPLAAQSSLNRAEKLEAIGAPEQAGKSYQGAIHFSPLDAENISAVAGFMLRQAKQQSPTVNRQDIKQAVGLFRRAGRINPAYAEYNYLLGNSLLELGQLNEAIDNFRLAIKKDVYNLRNNYLIGSELLALWSQLDQKQRTFALERLKFVLQMRPEIADSVYPEMIYYTGDFNLALQATPETLLAYQGLYAFLAEHNLWAYRKQIKQRLDSFWQQEKPQQFQNEQAEQKRILAQLLNERWSGWRGKSWNGKNEYQNGEMYWRGRNNRLVQLPAGQALIHLQARADPADNIWPYMVVELNGREIGESFVNSGNWQEYTFHVNTQGAAHVLSVNFVNDATNQQGNADRNLFLGEVRVVGEDEIE